MQIILLSGGSGTRLWPLSNDARSKQFLRLLSHSGAADLESMIQRVVRQIKEADIEASLSIATSYTQQDSVISQLGDNVQIITEPCRRDTFPAICLATEYLRLEKKCAPEEVVVVMPCDPYAEQGYFHIIKEIALAVENDLADLMVMGIKPTYPSTKYGYVVPDGKNGDILKVSKFTEKPDVTTAEELIANGALWNGGVFAFKLGYLNDISRKYVRKKSFEEVGKAYGEFPKISFDYEVAEKATNIGMIPYEGKWKDLGTWNTLTDELETKTFGNVTIDGTLENTHVFNELEIPLMCIGTKDLVIAASPDGILVSEKSKSENIKEYAARLKQRPMYEERRWGKYRVVDHTETKDGYKSLTKRITLDPDARISYHRHKLRKEVWTFIEGEGEIFIEGEKNKIHQGDTVVIPAGTLHAIHAFTSLAFIEVQIGNNVTEDDIERLECDW